MADEAFRSQESGVRTQDQSEGGKSECSADRMMVGYGGWKVKVKVKLKRRGGWGAKGGVRV